MSCHRDQRKMTKLQFSPFPFRSIVHRSLLPDSAPPTPETEQLSVWVYNTTHSRPHLYRSMPLSPSLSLSLSRLFVLVGYEWWMRWVLCSSAIISRVREEGRNGWISESSQTPISAHLTVNNMPRVNSGYIVPLRRTRFFLAFSTLQGGLLPSAQKGENIR